MASAYNPTPLPPPPSGFTGGNRTTQHVVGGASSNMGYSAGANLANARNNYAAGRAGSTFRNQAAERPQFTSPGNGIVPSNAQAIGAQMRANTSGMVQNPNSTPGMGYGNLPAPIRQHTIAAQNGNEWGSYNMAEVRGVAPTVPPPPVVGGGVSTGGGGTGGGGGGGIVLGDEAITGVVGGPGGNYIRGDKTIVPNPLSSGGVEMTPGVRSNEANNAALRTQWSGKVVKGAVIPSLNGTKYTVSDMKAYNINDQKVFVPLVVSNGKTVVHPAWQLLVQDRPAWAVGDVVKKDTIGYAPGQGTTKGPAPVGPGGDGGAAARIEAERQAAQRAQQQEAAARAAATAEAQRRAAEGAARNQAEAAERARVDQANEAAIAAARLAASRTPQGIRSNYGAVAAGTGVVGSDGLTRYIQKRAVNPATGTQVPWVNKPGGGYMVHPDWQGV